LSSRKIQIQQNDPRLPVDGNKRLRAYGSTFHLFFCGSYLPVLESVLFISCLTQLVISNRLALKTVLYPFALAYPPIFSSYMLFSLGLIMFLATTCKRSDLIDIPWLILLFPHSMETSVLG
jgi:hypothetical protein